MKKMKGTLRNKIAKHLSIALCITIPLLGYAGQISDETKEEVSDLCLFDDDKPLLYVDQLPEFKGGDDALNKYISDNLRYPAGPLEKGVHGRVLIRFVITKSGEVADPEVIRGVDPILDKEALRVIAAMPKWTPGKHEGKTVAVYYSQPIVFKLREKPQSQSNSKSLPIIILDGKEVTEAELKSAADEKTNDAKQKWDVKSKTLTSEEAREKYGEKYEGKTVMEIIFEEGLDNPTFPGGEEKMTEYIRKNLRYPQAAQKAGIKGRVAVRFVVRKTGDVDSVMVIRKLDPLLDKEAIRVIENMPKWNPGKRGGKSVDSYMTVPIIFNLNKRKR